MALGGGVQERLRSAVARYQHAPFVAVLLLLSLMLLIDELTGPEIRLGPLMAAAPALVAILGTPLDVLLAIAVTFGFVIAADARNNQIGTVNFPIQLVTTAIIATAAMAASMVRRTKEKQLAQVRWVAEVAQGILLRPLPARLGSLSISSMYLAADEEAKIGGDLYAVAETGGVARIVIGDAQGKGLGAVEVAGYLLSAFRRAASKRIALPRLARYLDRDVTEALEAPVSDDAAGTGAAPPEQVAEGFITAVVIDVPECDDHIEMLNCGHPVPLLLRDGRVVALEPAEPAPPLGLGRHVTGEDGAPLGTAEFAIGDTLLLYTDGLSDARDASGTFYPLLERLEAWVRYPPDELLRAIRTDLERFVDGRLTDDVALIAVRRTPSP